jgi:hypothetical protein
LAKLAPPQSFIIQRIAYPQLCDRAYQPDINMAQSNSQRIESSELEYRAIETALLETARGRWFLSEFGRRARRLDTALLEDAVHKLKTSLREPPALLGQLQTEVAELRLMLTEARARLLEKSQAAPVQGGETPAAGILRAAEELHEIAWGLQANETDAVASETIARTASSIYALSIQQSVETQRALAFAAAIDQATARLDGLLETIAHEQQVDAVESPSHQEIEELSALIDAPSGHHGSKH